MKKWFIFIVCLWAFQASAQGTYTATSCSLSAISAAIAAEQAHPADGDTISIPAGTCTWNSGTTLAQTFANSVTIQGQGAISATTGGASTTGSDVTTIIDNMGGNAVMLFTTTAGKFFRLTGIAFKENGSSAVDANGMVIVSGRSTSVRVDHLHIFLQLTGAQGLSIQGSVLGVADHIWYESTSGSGANSPVTPRNGSGWNGSTETGNATGDHSWNDTEHWGSNQFFFFEDSLWSGWDIGDASVASRFVLRHNTVSSPSNGQMYWHGQNGGRSRGTRAAEVYSNIYTRSTNTSGAPSISVNSGTLLYWGNTSTNYRYMVSMDYTRKWNSTYNYGTPPTGWGNCDGSTVSQVWDGPAPGYPCMEQPGYGRGDLLANDFPNVVNVTQGNIPASTRPDLSPIYIWNNTFNAAGFTPQGYISNDWPTLIADNREYYQQFNASFGESGSFDGTKGIGQGLLSARPSTCTAGLGGNTPGVGYWATDTNTLYVCNPTNTWTTYYTPFTYPHPLTQSSLGTAPAPPTNLSATVN